MTRKIVRRKSAAHVIPRLAVTPTGEELVITNECEEPTRIMQKEDLALLLKQVDLHQHKTAQMPAVKV